MYNRFYLVAAPVPAVRRGLRFALQYCMRTIKISSTSHLKFIVGSLFLLTTSASHFATAHEASHDAGRENGRKIAKAKEDRVSRLSQAKELLGSHYQHSVVRFGEKVSCITPFLNQQVEAALPKKYKSSSLKMTQTIITESKKYGFDPLFVLAVMTNESHLNPTTRGQFGEIGLMQIKPDTAKWISQMYHMKWKGDSSLTSITTNIKIGTAYLDYLREKFDKHSQLYLSAYNMGPANVRSALSREIWPKDYAIRVMDYYVKFYADLTDHPLLRKPATEFGNLNAMAADYVASAPSGHNRKPQSLSIDPMLAFDPIAND
jgi:soluble lytic murein transglycosylase